MASFGVRATEYLTLGFPVPFCSVQDCSFAFRSSAQFARTGFGGRLSLAVHH